MEQQQQQNIQNSRNLWALCTNNQHQIRDVLEKSEDPFSTGKSLLLQIFWELEQEMEEDVDDDVDMDLDHHPESKSSKSCLKFQQWIHNLVFNNGRINNDLSEMSKLFKNSHQMMVDNQKEISDIQNTILEIAGGHQGLITMSETDGLQNPDGFMYKDLKDIENKTGTRSRANCRSCGSTNTKQIALISHSCSFAALQQLFTLRLTGLRGKKLLDIGSGLGSIMYAAYCLSQAEQITGIELNGRLCGMVSKIIASYGLNNRMRVVEGDLKNFPDLLQECDVVIFNNAFAYFVPPLVQIELWQFIKRNLRSGCIIVTNPSLVELLTPLQPGLGIDIDDWVSNFSFSHLDSNDAYEKSVALSVIPKPDENFHIYNII